MKEYAPLPNKTWKSLPSDKEEQSSINFITDEDIWVMQIVNDKGKRRILFNTEAFPDLTPDDFAKKVIQILKVSTVLDDLIIQEAKEMIKKL